MVAVGGRSSVVRALAAQASDLGSIPSGFPVRILFHAHSPFSACVSKYQHLTNLKCLNIDDMTNTVG